MANYVAQWARTPKAASQEGSTIVARGVGLIIAAILLQWFPVTGMILMMLAAIIWPLVIFYATMIELVVKAWLRVVDRRWLAFPLCVFAGYALLSGADRIRAERHNVELQTAYAHPVGLGDPGEEIVVVDSGEVAGQVAQQLGEAVPRTPVYFDGKRSFAVGANCDYSHALPAGVELHMVNHKCYEVEPVDAGAVALAPIRVTVGGAGSGGPTTVTATRTAPGGAVTTRQVVLDGEAFLFPLPVFWVGCGLNDQMGKWDCGGGALRSPLQSAPRQPDYLAKSLGLL